MTPGLGLLAVILLLFVVQEPKRGAIEARPEHTLQRTSWITDMKALCRKWVTESSCCFKASFISQDFCFRCHAGNFLVSDNAAWPYWGFFLQLLIIADTTAASNMINYKISNRLQTQAVFFRCQGNFYHKAIALALLSVIAIVIFANSLKISGAWNNFGPH